MLSSIWRFSHIERDTNGWGSVQIVRSPVFQGGHYARIVPLGATKQSEKLGSIIVVWKRRSSHEGNRNEAVTVGRCPEVFRENACDGYPMVT